MIKLLTQQLELINLFIICIEKCKCPTFKFRFLLNFYLRSTHFSVEMRFFVNCFAVLNHRSEVGS